MQNNLNCDRLLLQKLTIALCIVPLSLYFTTFNSSPLKACRRHRGTCAPGAGPTPTEGSAVVCLGYVRATMPFVVRCAFWRKLGKAAAPRPTMQEQPTLQWTSEVPSLLSHTPWRGLILESRYHRRLSANGGVTHLSFFDGLSRFSTLSRRYILLLFLYIVHIVYMS